MLNQIVLVGRLVNKPEIKELESGKKIGYGTLAIPRSFKNINGEYETDFVPVVMFGGVAENTAEYCEQGDLVGVKGRVQSREDKIEIIAEKVTFLSTNHKED